MKMYTGKGDGGETDTLGRGRIAKDSAIAILLGDIDELNSSIGVAVSFMKPGKLAGTLSELQNSLFKASADIASAPNKKVKSISARDIEWLEEETDRISKILPKQKKFVIPQGSNASALLHLARAVARRAERSAVMASRPNSISPEIIAFMNRVSSLLFACALLANKEKRVKESNPSY